MKVRELDAVEKALAQAADLTFPLYEWELCKKLKTLIIEEIRVTKLLQDLVTQDPEKVFEQLSKGVASANEIKLESPVASKARKLLAGRCFASLHLLEC